MFERRSSVIFLNSWSFILFLYTFHLLILILLSSHNQISIRQFPYLNQIQPQNATLNCRVKSTVANLQFWLIFHFPPSQDPSHQSHGRHNWSTDRQCKENTKYEKDPKWQVYVPDTRIWQEWLQPFDPQQLYEEQDKNTSSEEYWGRRERNQDSWRAKGNRIYASILHN